MKTKSRYYLLITLVGLCVATLLCVCMYEKSMHRKALSFLTPQFWPRSPHTERGPEVRQVIFAKVHKAASSTVQNILIRFALARNLSVLLPNERYGPPLNEFGSKLNKYDIIPHPPGMTFDILCNHIIFDESEIAPYFPKNTAHVAILREPLKQALSALRFYSTTYPSKALKAGFKKYHHDPVNGFLSHPEDFANTKEKFQYSYVNNRMSIDLGFDIHNLTSAKTDETKIREFVNKIEEQFGLVLIADYFDESMILLRRYLNWSMKDIIYTKINAAEEKRESVWDKTPSLNSTQLRRFKRWAPVDYALYDHFLSIFLERIKNQTLFTEEVEAFRDIQQTVHDFCLNDTLGGLLNVPESEWTSGFTVTKSLCDLMSYTEDDLVALTYQQQIERLMPKVKHKSISRH